jgi:peptidoglycan/xylan/chitin deacetylase (PgdA/CDA1 family)
VTAVRPKLTGAAPLRLLATLVLALLASAALALAVAEASTQSTTTGTGTTTPATTPTKPSAPATKPTLYRVVGCRSTGTVAHREGPHRKEVAIGFDDGPWEDTPAFVTMLERLKVRATFFMIGRQVTSSYRSTLLRELRNGDVLGDHTFTHPDLATLSAGEVRSQLLSTIGAIRSLTGYTPCVFRPPYGDYDSSVLQIARSLGLSTVLWNVDPTDWATPGTAAIEQRVLAQVQPGSIIISHDGGGPRGQTLAAYPNIIRALRVRGYRIVTILELLGYRPIYEPCIKLCDGIGVPRKQVPAGAIVQHSP